MSQTRSQMGAQTGTPPGADTGTWPAGPPSAFADDAPHRQGAISLPNPTGAQVPPGVRIYAVGDIHGRFDLLRELQSAIDADLAARPADRPIEVYLGDYVDRGPRSAQVIEALIARRNEREVICLAGNHEAMMLDALDEDAAMVRWLGVGGVAAALSYFGDDLMSAPMQPEMVREALNAALPQAHRAFLCGLYSSFVCGDYLFVHAGVRPGVPLEQQSEHDLIWIRQDFLDCTTPFEKIVVHGHTPVASVECRPNRIAIDTGAFATGRLSCLRLEGASREVLATGRFD